MKINFDKGTVFFKFLRVFFSFKSGIINVTFLRLAAPLIFMNTAMLSGVDMLYKIVFFFSMFSYGFDFAAPWASTPSLLAVPC